jgi:hypothetical protein
MRPPGMKRQSESSHSNLPCHSVCFSGFASISAMPRATRSTI